MRSIGLVAAAILLLALHVTALKRTAAERTQLPQDDGVSIVMPSPILRITALEFKEVMSDLLLLDALILYGETLNRVERPRVKVWEWVWLERTLSAAVDLDPYFFDPYYFGNAILTWEGGMITEANRLLEKGTQYRSWDWMLPFLLGFNNFYFIQENQTASKYLLEASRRPGGSPWFARIAAKLEFEERRTENSILFLEETIKSVQDESLKHEFLTRIDSLRRILYLEQAVEAYTKRYNRKPTSLRALIDAGLIKEIPPDPYGGEYYLAQGGVVKSTTEHLLIPARRERAH